MKEATAEASMSLVTVVLVGAVLTALTVLIGFLITKQSDTTKCENAGYEYKNGKCYNGNNEVNINALD